MNCPMKTTTFKFASNNIQMQSPVKRIVIPLQQKVLINVYFSIRNSAISFLLLIEAQWSRVTPSRFLSTKHENKIIHAVPVIFISLHGSMGPTLMMMAVLMLVETNHSVQRSMLDSSHQIKTLNIHLIVFVVDCLISDQ